MTNKEYCNIIDVERQLSDEAPRKFLDAWKKGVNYVATYIEPEYFKIKLGSDCCCQIMYSKDNLRKEDQDSVKSGRKIIFLTQDGETYSIANFDKNGTYSPKIIIENEHVDQIHSLLGEKNLAQGDSIDIEDENQRNIVQKIAVLYGSSNHIESVQDKFYLQPNIEFIKKCIGVKSSGQRAFVALMCCFFNPEEGQKLLEKAGFTNFVNALAFLDWSEQKLIAELCTYYRGF